MTLGKQPSDHTSAVLVEEKHLQADENSSRQIVKASVSYYLVAAVAFMTLSLVLAASYVGGMPLTVTWQVIAVGGLLIAFAALRGKVLSTRGFEGLCDVAVKRVASREGVGVGSFVSRSDVREEVMNAFREIREGKTDRPLRPRTS